MVSAARTLAVAACALTATIVFISSVSVAPAHAETTASSTARTDLVLRGAFDASRRGIDAAAAAGTIASSSTTNIFSTISNVLSGASTTASSSLPSVSGLATSLTKLVNANMGSSSGATTTTTGLGASIAGSITGGLGGTAHFGPFIKCNLLSGIGWPIPTYATECPTATSTPPIQGQARITLVKNTVGGNGTFEFTIGGGSAGTTTVVTTAGTGTIQLLVNPGSISITEVSLANWIQTSRRCTLSGNSTGTVLGALGWSLGLNSGDNVTCTFVNTATSTTASTSTSTTTPPGGGGCVSNCGGGGPGPNGGGCVSNCGGGGPGPTTTGGGCVGSCGGNGPISDVSPTNGSNGPIVTGGGTTPGQVLGNSTSIPGVPNTGAGGNAAGAILMLVVSFAISAFGIFALRRMN